MGILSTRVLPPVDYAVYDKQKLERDSGIGTFSDIVTNDTVLGAYTQAQRTNGLTTLPDRVTKLPSKAGQAKKTAKAAYDFFKSGARCLMTLITPFPFLRPVARLSPVFSTVDYAITADEACDIVDDPRNQYLTIDHSKRIVISLIAFSILGIILTLATPLSPSLILGILGVGTFFIGEAIEQHKLNVKYA